MRMKKKILLTGDRPTGKLHFGHYIGSLKSRFEMQKDCETYIMVADAQAATDNFDNIDKVRENIYEVVCDYLAVGIDPKESHIFIQSMIPELAELTMYYMNIVSIQLIGQNPTVKAECKMRGYNESIPAGFYLYPIYQVADITAFQADIVPVGRDQTPMLELTRHVARRFNQLYKQDIITIPEAVYPNIDFNVPGIDGQKMSKSLGNAISLGDDEAKVIKMIKRMKSDENRKSLSDPGDPDNAVAFTYLDLFDDDKAAVEKLKDDYRAGGLPDKVVKERLTEVLLTFLKPIRERREEVAKDKEMIYNILKEGTEMARARASKTLVEVKQAMGISYDFMGL